MDYGNLNEEEFYYTKALKLLLNREKKERRTTATDRASGADKITRINALNKLDKQMKMLLATGFPEDLQLVKIMKLEREYIHAREKRDLKIAISMAFPNQAPEGTYNLAEIGKVFGITRERVRQIEQAADKVLRHPRVAQKLKAYKELSSEGTQHA